MALQETQSEPSMEEILASIRRIISEDDQQQPPARPPAREASADAILELNEPAHSPEDLLVFEAEDPEEELYNVATPAPAAPPVREPPAAASEPGEPLMSHGQASAAAGSFTRLAGSLRIADQAGQTVEGVVRELLRPMLRDWLEQNLPAIVEAKVEAELERISRLSR